MGKRVIVLASGETERRAVPHLARHLDAQGVSLLEVRIPPRHNALNVGMVEQLVRAVWFGGDVKPDKFVSLVDVDGKTPDHVLAPLRQLLLRLDPAITASFQFAFAQWHLEAWYFADQSGLRAYLGGKALGSVDTSAPDDIHNPKEHLKHLLDKRAYTAVISEEIAKALDAQKIAQRSPSFSGFVQAMRNGTSDSTDR